MQRTMTQIERDYCSTCMDDHAEFIFEKCRRGKLLRKKRTRYIQKLEEWETQLESIQVDGDGP